jgi:hypothetical protein
MVSSITDTLEWKIERERGRDSRTRLWFLMKHPLHHSITKKTKYENNIQNRKEQVYQTFVSVKKEA